MSARVTGTAAAAALLLGCMAVAGAALWTDHAALAERIALPLAMMCTLVLLVPLRRVGPRAAGWIAMTLLSWGATLTLIDAPPAVGYQHLRFQADHPLHAAAWIVLGIQLITILTAGRDHVQAIIAWVRAHGRPFMIILAAACFLLPGAGPSADPRAYASELLLWGVLRFMSLVTLVAAVRTAPAAVWTSASALLARVLGPEDAPGPRRIDGWVLRLATGVVLIAAGLAWFVYEAHPHVPDEVGYLLHAKYFAEGMLTMPLPPVPAGFHLDLMTYEASRWYSPVPPGWPAVLAVGVLAGVPWLVNPVLAGVAIVLTYLVMGRIGDMRLSRLTTLLLAASPWFLFMAMNFMTHTLSLTLALAATLGVAVARQHGSWLATFLAGLAVGATALVRPLEALTVALLLGFWSLPARGRRFRLAPSVALVAGTVVTGLLTRPYNAFLTGSSREFPLMAYMNKYYTPGSNDMGFGPNRGLGWDALDPFPGHGPVDVVVNTAANTAMWNFDLIGWPFGAVLLAASVILLGRTPRRSDWWLLIAVAGVMGAHAFYWFNGGPDFGARYWYLIIVPCCALAARGLELLDATREAGTRHHAAARTVALLFIPVMLIVFVPWRSVGKYRHYRNMRPDVRHLARQHEFGRSLVLVRGERHPDYASAATYNPVDLRADAPIYAWYASAGIRDEVLDAYSDRMVWIIDGPSVTGDGFRVAAGPLTPREARNTSVPPHSSARHVYDPVHPRRRGTLPK